MSADDSCSNGQNVRYGGAWPTRAYSYAVRLSSFGNNTTTQAAMTSGHRNWDTTFNGCGFGDQNNVTSTNVGTTTSTAHTTPDGLSVVDRGSMANVSCSGFIACTRNFPSFSSFYTETDQRYSDAVTWTNTGASGAYDYQAVATHESGHSIGLNHANSSEYLTMYHAASTNTTRWRSLARGDIIGMRTIYPPL